jgi:hypothetical protein
MANGKILRRTRIFGRTTAATAILIALSFNAASAADVAYFKDVLKPGGHTRSMTAKLADGRACGVSGGYITKLMPAFETCMSGRGWALDHYGADPASPRPRDTAVNFTDVKGDAKQQPRGNAALQADTRACTTGGKDVESASFKSCMSGRGWQFAFTQRAPAPIQSTQTQSNWAWSNSSSEPSSGANNDDFVRGNQDSNASNQAISDSINAASQATIDSDAAAAAQAQLDSIQANAPTSGN